MSGSRASATYNLRQHYSGGLWTLFAISAFPPHLWTLVLFFRDFSWLSERSNSWDALGVGAYGLLFAAIESLLVFIGGLLLGLLIHPTWSTKRRILLLSVLILLTAGWGILGQLYFLWGGRAPEALVTYLASTAHPLRLLYIFLALLIAPSIVIPVFLLLRSEKALQIAASLVERLTLLSGLYLSLDAAALAIVVIRNL